MLRSASQSSKRQTACCLVLRRELQRQTSDKYDLAYVNIEFVGWDCMFIRGMLHEILAMDGSRLLPL
ncbi:MAG: hypothetical protein IIB56_00800 [Planctomycetes bacterium]|nr:hypothetical protein [Planctomycetota bacterium]